MKSRTGVLKFAVWIAFLLNLSALSFIESEAAAEDVPPPPESDMQSAPIVPEPTNQITDHNTDQTTAEPNAPNNKLAPPMAPHQSFQPIEKPYYTEDSGETLPSPTADFDSYENLRLDRMERALTPKWGFSIVLEPIAFKDTDFRFPRPAAGSLPNGRVPSEKQPEFFGLLFGVDRILTRKVGVLAIGIQGGIYSAPPVDGYSGVLFGMPSLGPTLEWQLLFLNRQLLIPFGKVQFEALYQMYTYEGQTINTVNYLGRYEGGIYFNFELFDSTRSELLSNFGAKRCYPFGSFTHALDNQKKVVDLEDTTWRAGVRFEF